MSDTDQTRKTGWPGPAAIVCAIMFIVTAVALRPTLGALGRHYSKERVDLLVPVQQFDTSRLKSFRVKEDFVPDAVAYQDLGTDDYTTIGLYEEGDESTFIVLFITYYSDPRDSIPHTPEVCYRQHGAMVEDLTDIIMETPELGPQTPSIGVRKLEIQQPAAKQALIYTFCSNGKFYADRERVRWAIGWPGDKYTYFSKVEAVTIVPEGTDPEIGFERCKRLLREAIPILLETHYPASEDLGRK